MGALQKLIYKDSLVLIRDRGGLAMLFIMPMALVLIMTSLQNNTFKAINESGINLILLNHDSDSLGSAIENEIESSDFFNIHREINGSKPTENEVREAVASGSYQIGIIIPEDATRVIRQKVKENVLRIFSGDTTSKIGIDSVLILLYIDPATKNSLRSTLQGSIREYSARVESRIVFSELTREINSRMMIDLPDLNSIRKEIVYYHEEYVARNNLTIVPNAVQHNVPAWTLFAMFFIVIPFASSMIKEREDSSLARLLTMPCSYASILISKMTVYLLVCYLQFLLIMLMGVYLFPIVGLPSLDIDGRFPGLSVMAIAASLAAIGYGVAVGTIARTHQQAAIFASISVVILAAIGGIWVPVFIMPSFMRDVSVISPMNWGLHGFYDILVRNENLTEVIHYAFYLVLFCAACLLMAMYYHNTKKELD
jgi:ABC-2 type transport system permease protein